MSKNDEELNEKRKQLLTADDPMAKNSQSSIVKSGYGTPESSHSRKKLEKEKSEFDDASTDETNYKLTRSISFPSHPEKKSESKDLQLRYPFHEEEEEDAGQNSPVLYQSKSSLWSVTSDLSSIANYKNSENSRKLNKTSKKYLSALSDHDEAQRSSPEDAKLNNSCTAKEASRSQLASPQHVDCQKPTFMTINNEKANSNKKSTKGLIFSVQDIKAKTDRDPQLINEDLKVNFQDIIAEPHGYYTPQFSWSLSREVFDFAKGCFYTVVSFLCAIPFACFWGMWFSILTCCNVWCLMPFKRSHIINIAYWKFCWGAIVSCFCDPLCRSLGMTLSNISMRTEKHIV